MPGLSWRDKPTLMRHASWSGQTSVANLHRSDGTLGFNQGERVYQAQLSIIGGDLTMSDYDLMGTGKIFYTLAGTLKVLYQTET
jgi:hypothetical protein